MIITSKIHSNHVLITSLDNYLTHDSSNIHDPQFQQRQPVLSPELGLSSEDIGEVDTVVQRSNQGVEAKPDGSDSGGVDVEWQLEAT